MEGVEGLLIDLDGTVYQGERLLPGAAEAVNQLRDRDFPHLFTTNTSRKSRRDVAAALGAMGLAVAEERVFTAPVAAARWLEAQGLRRVQLLVPDSTRVDFEDFEITEREPEAVLVGDLGAGFTFERLNEAFRSLRTGASLVAIHRNRYWLPDDGPTLDAGPFVAALEYATGQSATLVGKPAPAFFEMAASVIGLATGQLAIVGDDPESDMRGGRAVGSVTFQVRSGKYREGLPGQAGAADNPDVIVDSLADVTAYLL